jgi:predicted helicase
MPAENGKIYFHDIGDYLTREEKLERITAFGSIEGIGRANGWLPITPDQHNDWVKQRDDSFGKFVSIGDKEKGSSTKIFENFSLGVVTNRDAWCHNASKSSLTHNMRRMIDFYNSEVDRYKHCVRWTSCEESISRCWRIYQQ